MKPIGFPVPRAPVALFRLRPSGYVANKVPMAGGETTAVPRPRKPQSTFMAMGFRTNAVASEVRLRNAMPERSWSLRPKRSAVFPKNSMKEPLARLGDFSKRFEEHVGIIPNGS